MDHIKLLCSMHQFVFLQEHWLISENLGVFENYIPDISYHAISAMDSGLIFQGRPFGGCAILWSSNSKCVVTPIETHNSRVCAVTVKKFLLVNVCMPTDTIHDIDNRIEYDNVLSSLSAIAIDCAPDAVIFGGDFNTDFSRSESLHTISLINFLPDESLFEPANEIDFFESMTDLS